MTDQSPLSEIPYDALNELFDKDPLELTKEDLSTAVRALRAKRVEWEAEESAAKREGRAPKKKLASGSINLDNLDLEF